MFDIQKSILMQTVFSCKTTGNTEEAKTFLNTASKYCFQLETLDEISYLQSEIKDYSGCIDSLQRCLKMATMPQQQYAIRANLAKVYNHLNQPNLSIEQSKLNQEIEPQKDYNTIMEISFSHYLLGDYITSEKMMRELNDDPNTPEVIRNRVAYNLGSYDMEKGEFKKGLKGFIDVGHRIGIWKHRSFENIPEWDGKITPGKTLFIHAEGGIGDEIIGVRFVKQLVEKGMRCIWITNHSPLQEVFNRNGYETVVHVNPFEYDDTVQCMAMYLPILMNLDKDQVWNGPYLQPSQEYIEKWKKILPEGKKLAVKFSGNSNYEQDLHRSIPVEFMLNLKYDGTLINLQLEPENYREDMFNAGEHISNIEDTLALLWLCDSFVSSCTSVVHMAASMGKNGVVCPPIASYYVWLGTDGYSNWYDKSLKVVRQTKYKDWNFSDKVKQLL